ncbi:MAG: nucleotidyltransferase family protein [Geobacteraceae bacterium]|nr:nucleotidyltransferase family protein [Geobacteraceae bacterium]
MGEASCASALPGLPARHDLSPEFRLAVACSWIAPAPLERLQGERIASLWSAGTDWDAFLSLVDRHGIPVQALTVLRRHLGNAIPEHLAQELLVRKKRVAIRSLIQRSELVRVNRLLREHGIEMIPLKGVLLSQRQYGDPGIRVAGDLDILVRPGEAMAADRHLAASGYRNVYTLTERQSAAVMAHYHHFSYCHKESGLLLELHWRSHFWSAEETEELWGSSTIVEVWGERFACLDDAILFLFLCDHGSKHKWSLLKWLSDIALLIAAGAIRDWDGLIALADRLGLRRMVVQGALLVHWLYGISLPQQLSKLVANEKGACSLAEKAIVALLAGEDEHSSLGRLLGGVKDAVYSKQIKPSLPVSTILKGVLMCHADFMTFPLPDSLFWLYAPLRPFFWFWRRYVRTGSD